MCFIVDDLIEAAVTIIVVAAEASPYLAVGGLALEGAALIACAAGDPALAAAFGGLGKIFGFASAISGVAGALDGVLDEATSLAGDAADAGSDAADAGASALDDSPITLTRLVQMHQFMTSFGSLGLEIAGDKQAASYLGMFGGMTGGALSMLGEATGQIASSSLQLAQAQIGGAVSGVEFGLTQSGDPKGQGGSLLGELWGAADSALGFADMALGPARPSIDDKIQNLTSGLHNTNFLAPPGDLSPIASVPDDEPSSNPQMGSGSMGALPAPNLAISTRSVEPSESGPEDSDARPPSGLIPVPGTAGGLVVDAPYATQFLTADLQRLTIFQGGSWVLTDRDDFSILDSGSSLVTAPKELAAVENLAGPWYRASDGDVVATFPGGYYVQINPTTGAITPTINPRTGEASGGVGLTRSLDPPPAAKADDPALLAINDTGAPKWRIDAGLSGMDQIEAGTRQLAQQQVLADAIAASQAARTGGVAGDYGARGGALVVSPDPVARFGTPQPDIQSVLGRLYGATPDATSSTPWFVSAPMPYGMPPELYGGAAASAGAGAGGVYPPPDWVPRSQFEGYALNNPRPEPLYETIWHDLPVSGFRPMFAPGFRMPVSYRQGPDQLGFYHYYDVKGRPIAWDDASKLPVSWPRELGIQALHPGPEDVAGAGIATAGRLVVGRASTMMLEGIASGGAADADSALAKSLLDAAPGQTPAGGYPLLEQWEGESLPPPDPAAAEGAAGEGEGATFPEKPGQIEHIFRDAEGHIADTPDNRALLQGVADDASTTLGTDRFGNVWSARTLPDGTQVWVQTRNGVIMNGGINQTPRGFNPGSGLSGR